MTTYVRGSSHRPLDLDGGFGRGGEAVVYGLVSDSSLAAKIYHKPPLDGGDKLRAMLTNVPTDPTRSQNHVSIAWPVDLVLDANGTVVGFLMARMHKGSTEPLLSLYNQLSRQKSWTDFTWRYLLTSARNIASVCNALHARGYVVDLNESNFLVSTTALVTLVDCDSVQAPRPGGGPPYRCTVGKPEYTAPELQGVPYANVDRVPAHDNFALAVLIFLMLMEGRHPFAGVWSGSGNPPTPDANIRAGDSPYVRPKHTSPPAHAIPFDILPQDIQDLFRRAFRDGHTNPAARPSPQEWEVALDALATNLTECGTNKNHVFSRHQRSCPWCARVKAGLPDPFPLQAPPAPVATTPAQVKLPPVTAPVPVASTAAATGPFPRNQPSRSARGVSPLAKKDHSKKLIGAVALASVAAVIYAVTTVVPQVNAGIDVAGVRIGAGPQLPFCSEGQRADFVLGFAELKRQIGATMGDPKECEHPNPDNGDSIQATSKGLAVFSKQLGIPMFTDGYHHWALTTQGLVTWLGSEPSDAEPPPDLQ